MCNDGIHPTFQIWISLTKNLTKQIRPNKINLTKQKTLVWQISCCFCHNWDVPHSTQPISGYLDPSQIGVFLEFSTIYFFSFLHISTIQSFWLLNFMQNYGHLCTQVFWTFLNVAPRSRSRRSPHLFRGIFSMRSSLWGEAVPWASHCACLPLCLWDGSCLFLHLCLCSPLFLCAMRRSVDFCWSCQLQNLVHSQFLSGRDWYFLTRHRIRLIMNTEFDQNSLVHLSKNWKETIIKFLSSDAIYTK